MGESVTAGRGAANPRGRRNNRIREYLGIRYADLAGARRFAAPVALPAGARVVQCEADRLAEVPIFPQLRSRLADALGEGGLENPQREDAFYLNVWAPDGADRLPVLFFIHGGAWMSGGGAVRWYEGTHLAAQGWSL
jgi:para-nitrobenzyl esterase